MTDLPSDYPHAHPALPCLTPCLLDPPPPPPTCLRSRCPPPPSPAAPPAPPRNLFDYDQVVNTQRDKVYGERRRALLAKDLGPMMREYAEKTADDIVEANVDKNADPAEWNLDALAAKMVQYCFLLEVSEG